MRDHRKDIDEEETATAWKKRRSAVWFFFIKVNSPSQRIFSL
jgi:hypothetical protein